MSDQGLFGPGSVTWRVHASPVVAMVGGLRSLIIQSLHPLAMAGVAQHSDYRQRPLHRLRRTAAYVATTTFGTTDEARRAAEVVKQVHRKVKGVDPVTGRAYSAADPETQLWVHCVEIHSFLASHRVYGRDALTPQEEDRYFAENVAVAALLEVPAERVPDSVAAMREYFANVRPQLCVSDSARDAISFVISPPLMRETAPYLVPMRVLGAAAANLVPRDLRRLAGIRAVPAPPTYAAVRAADLAVRLPGARRIPQIVLGDRVTTMARRAAA
jgi:uncharacterized protein (DUF2236 family)